MDGVIVCAEGLDGGDGEGVDVWDQLRAEEVELEDADEEEDGLHGGEGFACGLGALGDAGFLVERGDALADGDGAAVYGVGDVGGGGGEGDAACEGEGAAGGLD